MKKALLAAAGLAFAAIAMAQLSKYKDWSKSAEAYFLTPSEKDAWSKVRTDDEAAKFIADYWAKRDPNPATSANEYPGRLATMKAHSEKSDSASRHLPMSLKASIPIRKNSRSLFFRPCLSFRIVSML